MVHLRQWGLGGVVVERRGVVHLCDCAVRAACARPFLVCFARRGALGLTVVPEWANNRPNIQRPNAGRRPETPVDDRLRANKGAVD